MDSFLDIIVSESAANLQLFSCNNQTLLVWWDALLVLDISFDVLNSVTGSNLKCDGLVHQNLQKICISVSSGEAAPLPY